MDAAVNQAQLPLAGRSAVVTGAGGGIGRWRRVALGGGGRQRGHRRTPHGDRGAGRIRDPGGWRNGDLRAYRRHPSRRHRRRRRRRSGDVRWTDVMVHNAVGLRSVVIAMPGSRTSPTRVDLRADGDDDDGHAALRTSCVRRPAPEQGALHRGQLDCRTPRQSRPPRLFDREGCATWYGEGAGMGMGAARHHGEHREPGRSHRRRRRADRAGAGGRGAHAVPDPPRLHR